jgi:hypothetical protein
MMELILLACTKKIMNYSLPALKDRSVIQGQPFIGHYGVGARIALVFPQISSRNTPPTVIIRESILSQVTLIFGLAVTCIYPTWLVLAKPHLLNGGEIVRTLLLGTSLFTLPFLYK